MFDWRLIRADVLKLRRRRGVMAMAMVLTIGVTLLIYTVMAVQHATNPHRYGPAGGLHNYHDSINFLKMMVLVVTAIVGATAGAADLESGVFRDLAATGRDRLTLFGSRVVGAGLVLLPIVLALAAVTAVASIVLAGSLAAPGAGAIATGTAMLLAAGALGTVVAVGLAAVVGSRGPVIAIMLAFALAISPALSALGFLGDARAALPTEALDRIAGLPVQVGHTTVASASAVLVAWAAAAFAAGAWRTRRQEI